MSGTWSTTTDREYVQTSFQVDGDVELTVKVGDYRYIIQTKEARAIHVDKDDIQDFIAKLREASHATSWRSKIYL